MNTIINKKLDTFEQIVHSAKKLEIKEATINKIRPLPPPNPDPLLVGVKSIGTKNLVFLLGKFDLTADEKYISDEFTV